ncbi:hypothetical protein D1632_05795 [Chryseobacterium nematophagum]|uniref:TonB C-terminal domain-containing protein n=1 Tax=Chryseobacterium nematophagum TaxID=2305228 RepID=A0A3M7L9B7_9FLAO|nr:energy transducer TonB [Chryseobacterium nematophagum]RMZ59167.1 hypothetical protein D1632_05795 [Chryseobacterium nematophagum]
MKKFHFLIILLSTVLCFGQSSGRICSEFGLTISYSYQKTGNTIVNPQTETKFDEYIITCTANNASSTCVGFKDPIVELNLLGIDFGVEDNRFTAERAAHMSGHLNHNYNHDKCSCTDSRGYNFGILATPCPGTKSETHYTFVYPKGETPRIKWYECYLEQVGDVQATTKDTEITENKEDTENREDRGIIVEEPQIPDEIIAIVAKRSALCDELESLVNQKNITNSTYDVYCPKSANEKVIYASTDDYTLEDLGWLQRQVQSMEEAIEEINNPTNTDNEATNNETEDSEDEIIQEPEFPNGAAAFAQLIMDGLNMNNITSKGKIRSILKFVVLTDGSITNIEASGENESLNNEAVKAARSITTLWTPAMKKSGVVQYQLTLPIVFVIQ